MRNYRFAIVPYDPREEFKLRQRIRNLTDELKARGWDVLAVSLHRLLLDRLKSEEPRVLDSLVRNERRFYEKDPERALNYLKDKVALYVEGPDGIARDVIGLIDEFVDSRRVRETPACKAGASSDFVNIDRTLILLCRAGALYPFFRSSALLKHIDGKTRNLPVVLLYPGERHDLKALSFMGELASDRDYRPRVY
jgi:hypothetical protein